MSWRPVRVALRGKRRALAALTVWSAVEGVPALVSGLFVAASVDRGFAAGRPGTGLAWLGAYALVMALGAVATRRCVLWLGVVVEPLRDELLPSVVAGLLRAGAVARRADAKAVAQITQHVEAARDVAAGLLLNARHVVTSVVFAVAGLMSVAPGLVLPVAVPLLLTIGGLALLIRRLAVRQAEVMGADEGIAQSTERVMAGMRDIVSLGAEERAAAAPSRAIATHVALTRGLSRLGAARDLLVSCGGTVPIALVLLAAPTLLREGRLTVGTILGVITYLTVNIQPALRLLVNSVLMPGVRLSVILRHLAEAEPLPASGPASGAAPRDPLDLRLAGVTFAYGESGEPIVRGLHLTVPWGEHLAIVGPSGVGKSTLADLMTGLVKPTAGRVTLGGADPARAPLKQVRELVALIPQEAYLFAGTLRENLLYLRHDLPDEEIHAAALEMGLDRVIERAGGLDARIGPGGLILSPAERQLVALTRVHLSRAGVLVLDEATCHLDPAAEERAELALSARPGTLVVVAHRISSAMRADRVLVLDGQGPVIGGHEELLAISDRYAELIEHWQAGDSAGAAGAAAGTNRWKEE
ncbi:ABC transporter ATP-binding protein [Nonomuraea sp. NPDC003707]